MYFYKQSIVIEYSYIPINKLSLLNLFNVCFAGAQYGGGSELFYSQFELHSREQKINQIILLEVLETNTYFIAFLFCSPNICTLEVVSLSSVTSASLWLFTSALQLCFILVKLTLHIHKRVVAFGNKSTKSFHQQPYMKYSYICIK